MSKEQPKSDKSWQARISEATDALAQSFVESISYDKRLYKHDIAGSIAHATMLAKVGLISGEDAERIVEGLKGIERDIKAQNFTFDIANEDIHMVIEAELIKRIGEPGRKLHTGRSRNDQVALDLREWLDHAQSEICWRVHALSRAFVELATRSMDVVMPSYTHMQRAQPIVAGAEPLAWAKMLDDDMSRIEALSCDYLESPLGSGAIAGSSLPIDARSTAELLELLRAPGSSIEQT